MKRIQIRGYTNDPDNYALVFDVELEGDMALIQGLGGKDFYKNIDLIWDILSIEYGITQLYGTVMPEHAKVIKRTLDKRYSIRVIRRVKNAKRRMILLRCTRC